MRIVTAAEEVNDEQKKLLGERVVRRFGEDLSGRRFAVWGLAFKPKTDDVREAPAAVVIQDLLERGAEVVGCDPEGIDNFRQFFGDRIRYESDPYEAADGCDAVILCTEWYEFRGADFGKLRERLKQPVIFDGRNVIDRERANAAGFEYEGIGRGVLLEPAAEESPASV